MTIMDGGRRRFSGDGIPGHPITAAVTAELDRLVPTVNTTPPANWQPGQGGQAAGAAPAGAAPAATPAPAATGNRRNSGR